MTEFIANLETMRPDLEALLAEHASEPVTLLIVPSIAEWAKDRVPGFTHDPPGLALRAHGTSDAAIVVKQTITEEQADSIVGRVLLGGHPQAFHRLGTPVQFARHLILHELAHLENNWGQDRENECDTWAFSRLPTGA